MLDKLKLFNKDKSDRTSKAQISKRTSSSSGFSSARSERSDSSLSLNDGQSTAKTISTNFTATNSLKKPESSKIKSKLLAASNKNGSKDTLNSKKSDKKDKSPARSAEMTESKMAAPKLQKISGKAESKFKPTLNTKKIEVRSESKTSLSQITAPKPIPQTVNAPVNTGIPKPMAAIKGTTKTPTYHLQKSEQYDIKTDKLAEISNQNISKGTDGKMQICAPILIGNAVAHNQIINQMHHQQIISTMSDSSHSKSSIDPLSNSCESNIVYASLRHASMSQPNKLMLSNHRKMEKYNGEPTCMIKAPSNGSIASSNSSVATGIPATIGIGNNKFHTVPSKLLHSVNGIIYEEEKQMTVIPMRPLLRGYNSHLTLPTRGARSGQHMVSDYCDDIGQGYCSDGDALRKGSIRYNDIENGYMSEGGGVSNANTNAIHPKKITGLLRARTQLPTTIEER